jgi:1-acyl-sn-glycerol-3-phosphate acyltransferase
MTFPTLAWRWGLVRFAIRLLRGLAGIRLDVEGAGRVPAPGAAFVLAANHQSYLDALALIETVGRPLSFVAKRELEAVPFLGRFLARLGTLFVERFDLHRGAAESERFSAHLAAGASLAFFPEGTFRDAPGLLPFRMGAFVAAAREGLAVLPVALVGTRKILRGERRLPRPGRCLVIIGEPLTPAGSDWSEAARLRDATRAFILEHCAEPDLGGSSSELT